MAKTDSVSAVTRFVNLAFALLGRLGPGADYRYVLTVRGRRSGKAHSTQLDATRHRGVLRRNRVVVTFGTAQTSGLAFDAR